MLFEPIILLLAAAYQTLLVYTVDVISKTLDAIWNYNFVISNRSNAISLWNECY